VGQGRFREQEGVGERENLRIDERTAGGKRSDGGGQQRAWVTGRECLWRAGGAVRRVKGIKKDGEEVALGASRFPARGKEGGLVGYRQAVGTVVVAVTVQRPVEVQRPEAPWPTPHSANAL
jgi:hypothetical protein